MELRLGLPMHIPQWRCLEVGHIRRSSLLANTDIYLGFESLLHQHPFAFF